MYFPDYSQALRFTRHSRYVLVWKHVFNKTSFISMSTATVSKKEGVSSDICKERRGIRVNWLAFLPSIAIVAILRVTYNPEFSAPKSPPKRVQIEE